MTGLDLQRPVEVDVESTKVSSSKGMMLIRDRLEIFEGEWWVEKIDTRLQKEEKSQQMKDED